MMKIIKSDKPLWWALGAIASMAGCLGFPDALPDPLAYEDSGPSTGGTTGLGASSGEKTSGTTLSGTSLGETSGDTGPMAVCENDLVEEGEECDGTDWDGASCESLGYSETGLACVGCVFDVSGCGLAPGMVEVPGGVFEMGWGEADMQPVRQVAVDPFWIDETEVTVEAYSDCVNDEEPQCTEPGVGGGCNWNVAGREDHPVNCVTWSQAREYCDWVAGGTKRLPTEAEWEKAARGTDAREYPWGGSPSPSCTHVVMDDGGSGCGMASTLAVGSKTLGDSPYGVHDMAGNVNEWVADWYASSYDVTELDNPTGPVGGTARVLRGGSWADSLDSNFRAAYRSSDLPDNEDVVVGFRCARTPPAPL